MGVRTKWQRSEVAQLFIFAQSSICSPGDANEGDTIAKQTIEMKVRNPNPSAQDTTNEQTDGQKEASGWTHAEWELGKRLVGEAVDGEEAAVRLSHLSNLVLFDFLKKFPYKSGRYCWTVWMAVLR